MDRFIALAEKGKNDWWRYFLSLILIIFLWLIIGSLPFLAVLLVNGGMPVGWGGGEAVSGPLSGIDPFITFYLPVAFSFVMLAAGLYAAVVFIHKRPLMSLVCGNAKLDYKRVGQGFAAFLAINIAANVAAFAYEPSSFIISAEPARLLLIAPFFLALTALQTTSEELLFRGYLLQGAGRLLKRPLLAAFLCSVLFMLVHIGNPEMSNGFLLAALYYLYMGFWLSLVTLKDASSELAIGAHAATNMFILVVNYRTSALESIPSLFKDMSIGEPELLLSLVLLVALTSIAYAALFWRKGKAPQKKGKR